MVRMATRAPHPHHGDYQYSGETLKVAPHGADDIGMLSTDTPTAPLYDVTRDRVAYVRSFIGVAADDLVFGALAEIANDYAMQLAAEGGTFTERTYR